MTKIYKIIFLTVVILSTLISISSYTWLGMWLGLEINLLSIIPLMQNSKSMMSSEASMKYFIVQAIASTIIMASIISMMMKFNLTSQLNLQSYSLLMMDSALLTKMGAAPFHFWFPEVLEGLSWSNCLIVLTWQKIAPMVLLMYSVSFNIFFSLVIISSMFVSGILGFNQISLRKILAYSSINHMGWMISVLMIMETIWTYYFLIYALITLNLVMIFSKLKIFFLNQLMTSLNSNQMTKMWFILNFLSLSGVPPFLGFLPKWLTIQALVLNSSVFLPVIMILMTLMVVYMYMRITLSTLLMNVSEQNWNWKWSYLNSFSVSMINFFSITSMILVTIIFNIS